MNHNDVSDLRATRDGFGESLCEIAKSNDNIIGLCADLTESTRMDAFAHQFPKRFFNVGIAEQHMVGMAVGLSLEGYVPFVATYGVFLGRAWDQIRVSVCLGKANVKLVGSHAGVTVGADGASAQALEDIALFRVLPHMVIVCPCDVVEAKKATIALAEMVGPAYLRLSREKTPVVTRKNTPFVLGRAETLKNGKDVSIIACGTMVSSALDAALLLAKEQIDVGVVNMHTISPIDKAAIIDAAKHTHAIVVAEEHQALGGLGGAVAEVLALHCPTPMEQVAVQHTFGESGTAEELLVQYKLTSHDIVRAVKRVLRRKTKE
ncbi:MAG: transketolase family protein [Candidatus Pacebacteria bacterium]|nr:transketolase family protein [Candidatus Paceibacterota bacterium]